MNYEKLIKEKDAELKAIVQRFNREVEDLHREWSQHLAEKNKKYYEKIDKYLNTVCTHTFCRKDMGVYRRVVPFKKVYKDRNPLRCYAVVSWSSSHEKIEIYIVSIDDSLVSGNSVTNLKRSIFGHSIEWESVKTRDWVEENFSKMPSILTKQWSPEMGSREKEILLDWLKSYMEEEVSKVVKVTTAAKRFGV